MPPRENPITLRPPWIVWLRPKEPQEIKKKPARGTAGNRESRLKAGGRYHALGKCVKEKFPRGCGGRTCLPRLASHDPPIICCEATRNPGTAVRTWPAADSGRVAECRRLGCRHFRVPYATGVPASGGIPDGARGDGLAEIHHQKFQRVTASPQARASGEGGAGSDTSSRMRRGDAPKGHTVLHIAWAAVCPFRTGNRG